MRILNDDNIEIQESDIDLSIGECHKEFYVEPSAYDTIDNITKFALDDDDYEEIIRYHVWTEQELAWMEEGRLRREKEEAREKLLTELPQTLDEHSEMIEDMTLIMADLIGA